jgi:hypothetical protein
MTDKIIGQTIKLQAVFRDSSDDVCDPTWIELSVLRPGTQKITYTLENGIVRISEGVYQVPILLNKAGNWKYVWTMTYGEETALAQSTMNVVPRNF